MGECNEWLKSLVFPWGAVAIRAFAPHFHYDEQNVCKRVNRESVSEKDDGSL